MKKLKDKIKILSIALLSFSLLPAQILAICEGPIAPECPPGGCSLEQLNDLLTNITNFITTCLAPIFAVLMIVIGGAYFLISAGDPEKIATGKKVLLAAVIGLLFVLLASSLLNAFLSAISG